ncbi:MAG: RNA-binding S4 domain-containing protein [Methanomicrobia archaeon]|jgi:ribosomal 50S subunit-recycling heat shock protein|nr:RNA-binding S4 domain-containing protein [Methanomicrobia archaeon]
MRLDKFLKVSRIIKRRTVAKDIIDTDVILLNGRVAKPAAQVKVGDTLDLTLGRHHFVIKIKDIPTKQVGDPNDFYEVLEDQILERHLV